MEHHHAINGQINYKWPFSIAMLVYQRVPYLTIKHEMKKHHELGLCHEHPGDTKVPVFVVNRCARRTESW